MAQKATDRDFKDLFRSGKPFRIADIATRLRTSRATARRCMARHGTFTSVNGGGRHCALPSMCRFDPGGFCRIGELLFFRDGNQQDAVCRYVDLSEGGVKAADASEFFGVSMTMQLLRLSRIGRLRRETRGGSLVYFSASDERCAEQHGHRRRTEAERGARLTVGEMLAGKDRESLELLVKVLLTCLAHPGFSAKSIALSLVRRGESVCAAQVRMMFEQFGLVKKTSDPDSGNHDPCRKEPPPGRSAQAGGAAGSPP